MQQNFRLLQEEAAQILFEQRAMGILQQVEQQQAFFAELSGMPKLSRDMMIPNSLVPSVPQSAQRNMGTRKRERGAKTHKIAHQRSKDRQKRGKQQQVVEGPLGTKQAANKVVMFMARQSL